ncbi:MAG: sel1 repeat family protein [Gammaproteobacteria bacterium]|jgi:TPR repeat protein
MAIRSNILPATLTAILLLSATLIGGCSTTPRNEQQDPQTIMEEAHKAYASKEYEKVFRLLLPLAASGNDQAQYTIGYLYFHGLGVQKSETQAMSWIQRAAAQGNEKAQRALK